MTKNDPFARANSNRVLSDLGVVTYFCVVQYMYKKLSNQTFGNDKNDHVDIDDDVSDDGILFLAESSLTCESPPKIPHGQYAPVKLTYKVNVRVHYTCASGYFLWGARSSTCTALPGLPNAFWLWCDHLSRASCKIRMDTECLPLDRYEDKCKESGGYIIRIRRVPLCRKGR